MSSEEKNNQAIKDNHKQVDKIIREIKALEEDLKAEKENNKRSHEIMKELREMNKSLEEEIVKLKSKILTVERESYEKGYDNAAEFYRETTRGIK
jgi:small-conductance mechanosensitive channel